MYFSHAFRCCIAKYSIEIVCLNLIHVDIKQFTRSAFLLRWSCKKMSLSYSPLTFNNLEDTVILCFTMIHRFSRYWQPALPSCFIPRSELPSLQVLDHFLLYLERVHKRSKLDCWDYYQVTLVNTEVAILSHLWFTALSYFAFLSHLG